MKKLLLSSLASLAIAAPAFASSEVVLQGNTFTVDTLAHYYIGPGVTQSHLTFTRQGAARVFHAYVVTTDLTASDRVRPKVEIGRDSCNTAETLTSMAMRKTTAEAQYLAGINGDFFITSSFAAQHEFGTRILGYPNMACATDGQLIAPDIIDKVSRENAFMVTDGGLYIDATDLTYRIYDSAGKNTIQCAGVNYPRRANESMVYNSGMGKYTKTDATGREIVLRMKAGSKWMVNKSAKFIVETDWRQGGNSRIPEDGIVISLGPDFTHTNIAWLDALKKGDEMRVKFVCKLPAHDNNSSLSISEICGGDVRILNEGVTTTEAIRWINTPSSLYSRSMVGHDESRTKMVMCAIDAGGKSGSSGVSYYEGADVMRYLGCWDALDLDGGGSTAMWNHSDGIVNNLRDGSERAIGNGLYVRLDAPKDTEIASIRFADWAVTMPKFGTYEPVVYGYNQYGQLVDKDVKGFELVAPAGLGEVKGNALIGSGDGTHALIVRKGEMEASVAVTVDGSCAAAPVSPSVLLDNYHPWTIGLQATVGTKVMAVNPSAYIWTSDDPTVASVDANGVVTGHKDGVCNLTGTAGDLTVALQATVECPKAATMPLWTAAVDPADWKITTSSGNSGAIAPLGDDGGFTLSFKATSTRGPRVTAVGSKRIWSHPDAFEITVNPAGKAPESLEITIIANDKREFKYKHTEKLTPDQDNKLTISIADFGADPDDIALYPLSFKSVGVYSAKASGEHSFAFPRLHAVYSSYSGVGSITADPADGATTFRPVVDGRTIRLGFVADTVGAYDAAGRLIAQARNADALDLPAGFYILRATLGAQTLTARTLLR